MRSTGASKMRALCLLLLLPALLPALLPVSANAKSAAILPTPVVGQRLDLPRLEKAPTLEDFLDMKPNAAWAGKLLKVDKFIQREPTDGAPATYRTEAYLGYDNKNLYAIFLCFDDNPRAVRAPLAHRDDLTDDDIVEIMLDTFDDHRRAYAFISNPLGVQTDAIYNEANNNGEPFDFTFDTIWNSRGKLTPQGYVVWIAVPFRSLRFANADPQTWGVVLHRGIPRRSEKVYWPAISSRIAGRLNQEAEVTGMKQISPGRNIQINPYGFLGALREPNFVDPAHPFFSQRKLYGRVGGDVKVILKDKFVLDGTLNPDFSQIESDQPQVTVNQRFAVFFPERRPFFLENASYFQTPIKLVFTRNIGSPTAGLRLTGKDGPWAVGLLSADDRAPGQSVAPSDPEYGKRAFFNVARVSREVGKQSSIGAIYTDREFDGQFNRSGGIDTHLRINDHWTADAQAAVTSTRFADGTYNYGPAYEATVSRQGRQLNYFANYSDRSPGYYTTTGFYERSDVRNLAQSFQYSFRPEGKILIAYGPEIEQFEAFDYRGHHLNQGVFPAFFVELKGQTFASVFFGRESELLRPQDYSSLSSNTNYVRNTTGLNLRSNRFKLVNLEAHVRWGRRVNYDSPAGEAPFLANRVSAELYAGLHPLKQLRIDNNYLLFRLTDINSSAGIMNNHILRSKWNYQINKELSLRFIAQYNAVLANPEFTSLKPQKNLNFDFLASYLLHPGTAIYAGYNSNLQDLTQPLGVDSDSNPLHNNKLINDSRHFFVKVSYLYRF